MTPDPAASPYSAELVTQGGEAADIRLTFPLGKTWSLAGRGGRAREAALAEQAAADHDRLPVLLGSGLGAALDRLLAEHPGPVAVIDKEEPILACTGLRQRLSGHPGLTWIDAPNPRAALADLTRWQWANGGRPLTPVALPLYLRLDPEYYRFLLEHAGASRRFDFWAKAKYPKFQSPLPRILLITSSYFLMGEVVTACERLGAPHRLITVPEKETGSVEFVEQLLTAIVEFKPDFLFTINHLGVDREGVLIDLMERLELPLASWFVDNPHLILYFYQRVVSDLTAIFTWDADNLGTLKQQGFPHVLYLPLGVDAVRFSPPARPPLEGDLRDISFVGNSMLYKVGHRMAAGRFPRPLLLGYKDVAARFGEHDERSVRTFLAAHYPEQYQAFEGLDSMERKLAYEAMITWEATRRYRRRCVEQILPFAPVIAGDKGWDIALRRETRPWLRLPEMSYYQELPGFYPRFRINFNTTSKQMKGAVNQRVFDAPAAGAFVLTDWRSQMEKLFEPGTEIAFYGEPEEIPGLVRRYLDHPGERQAIIRAARRRILAEHTYEHRLLTLMDAMRRLFA